MSASLWRVAARNAVRKPARTVLTAGMVVAGVALLILAMSWIDGVFGQLVQGSTDPSGHAVVQTQAYADRAALMPLHENIAEAGPVVEAVRGADGVRAAFAAIEAGVTVGVGDEVGEVFGLATGGDAAWFTRWAHLDGHLVEGRWFAGEDELVLGWTLAQGARAKLGDQVLLLGQTQDGAPSPMRGTLVGIVRAGSAQVDRRAYLPLDMARRGTGIPNGAISVVAYADGHEAGRLLGEALRARPELAGLSVRAWTEQPPWDGMLVVLRGIRAMLYVVVVLLAALGVWNTMMMSVLERTTEIGVLRALGLSRPGAVGLFVGEATAIALLGSALGAALGVGATLVLGRSGVTIGERVTGNFGDTITFSQHIHPQLSPDVVATAFALGVVIACLGSLVPAVRAARIEPVVAMRRTV